MILLELREESGICLIDVLLNNLSIPSALRPFSFHSLALAASMGVLDLNGSRQKVPSGSLSFPPL